MKKIRGYRRSFTPKKEQKKREKSLSCVVSPVYYNESSKDVCGTIPESATHRTTFTTTTNNK